MATEALRVNLTNNLDIVPDLVKSYTYLDTGTVDERVSTITYVSTSLGINFTETYVWVGSTGLYRVSTITRVAN